MSDSLINRLYHQIMREFVYSRTAHESEGDPIFHTTITQERYRQYIFLDDAIYEKYDDALFRNMEIYTPRNIRTLGHTPEGYEIVRGLYQKQKPIRYANCQTQAMFLGLLLYEAGIEYIILQTRTPVHAFLLVKGDSSWKIADPWAGRLRTLYPINHIESSLVIKTAMQTNNNRLTNLNSMLRVITEYYPYLLNYNDYLTRTPPQARIREEDYYLSLYMADYAPDIFSSTGNYVDSIGEHAKGYHNVHYSQIAIKANILAILMQYREERSRGEEYQNFLNRGYSRDEKIESIEKLIYIISGAQVALTPKDCKVLHNGELGKKIKKVLSAYDPILLFEMLCYDEKLDSIANDPRYKSVDHDE